MEEFPHDLGHPAPPGLNEGVEDGPEEDVVEVRKVSLPWVIGRERGWGGEEEAGKNQAEKQGSARQHPRNRCLLDKQRSRAWQDNILETDNCYIGREAGLRKTSS